MKTLLLACFFAACGYFVYAATARVNTPAYAATPLDIASDTLKKNVMLSNSVDELIAVFAKVSDGDRKLLVDRLTEDRAKETNSGEYALMTLVLRALEGTASKTDMTALHETVVIEKTKLAALAKK